MDGDAQPAQTPRPTRMPTGLRRVLGRAAILVAGTLIALELTLQLGALAVALLAPAPKTASNLRADGRKLVLCVGDSFTYGLGASDPEKTSYPGRLGELLERSDPGRWQVVNEGYPGRNSRQLLERLGEQLDRLHPDFVCILVGLNDRWSHPERLDLDRDGAAGGSSFRLEFRTLRLWRWLAGKFASSDEPGPGVFTPRLANSDSWRADDQGTATAEQKAVVARSAADPSSPAAHAHGLDTAEASARETLLHGITPTVDAMRAATGPDLPLLRAVAHHAATSAPQSALRAAVLGFVLTGDRTRFSSELHACTAQDPQQLDAVLRSLDLARAERSAVAVAFADSLGWKQADGIWIQPSTGAQRALVDIRWEEIGPVALRDFENHREHLLQAFRLCRAKGAVPLLLGYPNRKSFPDEFLVDVSERGEAEFLSTVVAIEARLAKDPSAQLFVADGHCNDEGYRVMAEVVWRRLTGPR